jgi:hypothetical protein
VVDRVEPFFGDLGWNSWWKKSIETYVQLLVVARALLAGGLEVLAHIADRLVRLGEFCRWHLVLLLCSVSASMSWCSKGGFLRFGLGDVGAWWWFVFRVGSSRAVTAGSRSRLGWGTWPGAHDVGLWIHKLCMCHV